ncbi:hypothetical protein LX15_004806 [Streptoalloteichus tenebrarius]|uniref:Tail assembly chaperone n=1 Tax=Streptoalloteichus tenebrarius (strain ATCC 17920 / DSM 40477 / JCM 4838 / CBS 697.72 / NBRC 16177 / NCIMB 11028 / NRRL B-12390 / A12253. 1 / ISP 5477) TaxID=1933 RepID=A0ABT1I009_STRSD|nr:hypothetical protein [Streptoalloteichus tenebrarius]MCP2261086.1 hypothetical protein [Streptoalloteichus tenebrarius]BFF03119.1 hypothetical protein GCM10020241_47940 [Streptoalloteichus tenebrarius]
MTDQPDDFLAFWAEHDDTTRETRRILGVDVTVPHDLPLRFEQRLDQAGAAATEDDLRVLLVDLFGQDVLDRWVDAGITSRQLQVLLAWGIANGSGRRIGFAEAADIVAKAEAAKGKAASRAPAGGSSRTRASAGTGRSSKRTSAASMA